MSERFSASNAGKHMTCHASANLDIAIPNWVAPVEDKTVDNAANQGTAVHEMLAKAMEFSPAELRAYVAALDYVAQLRSSRRFNVLIEESIEATWLTVPTKTSVDLVLYVQDEIHVIDWKWGKIAVDVVDNEQLMFYAACFAPLAPKAKGVKVHIVQPRADNMNSWWVDTARLGQFMSEARAAQDAILAGSTAFQPSDHCKFCPANPHTRGLKGSPLCPEMMQLLYPKVVDDDAILAL